MQKHLAITGAGRGLGLHLAQRAREAGYAVVGIARAARDVEELGFPVLACDVADPAAVAAVFASLRDRPLWGVINAAGIASMNLAVTTPPATMERIVAVNLLGSVYCCVEGGKLLMRNKSKELSGGRIINFSTIAVSLALAGESVYAASKAGVETFSRCFAREVAAFGITVNCIAPGPVPTGLIAGVPKEKIDAIVRRQIIARQAVPEDIWHVASLLLEERSAMISGEVLRVGGA